MNNILFFSVLVIELILCVMVLDFYFGQGIVHSLILCGISALIVWIFYGIRKKSLKTKKKLFIQIGILILFGSLIVILIALEYYIISQI